MLDYGPTSETKWFDIDNFMVQNDLDSCIMFIHVTDLLRWSRSISESD